jgi:hypothetical protein
VRWFVVTGAVAPAGGLRVVLVACLAAKFTASLHVFGVFGFRLINVTGVSGGELDGVLGCDPGLELAAAFELDIELGAEEQCEGW